MRTVTERGGWEKQRCSVLTEELDGASEKGFSTASSEFKSTLVSSVRSGAFCFPVL